MKALTAVLLLLCLACAKPSATDTTTAATETTATTAAANDTTPAEAMVPTSSPQGPDTFSMPANLQTTPSGLQYTIDQPGTGAQPQPGQIVSVHYTGWLTNGTQFDTSRDSGAPIEFPLGQGRVIQGWEEGIAAMKVGEKRTLVIPPDLGYGARGSRDVIPPNATLVFKVELVGAQ